MSATFEPDDRSSGLSSFHKRILRAAPIANTRTGQIVDLECGHTVQVYGSLEHAAGYILCAECRFGKRDQQFESKEY